LSSTTSRCSITDDAATLLLGTSVLSSLKGGGLRQAEDPVNPLQPSPILSTKPAQLQEPFACDTRTYTTASDFGSWWHPTSASNRNSETQSDDEARNSRPFSDSSHTPRGLSSFKYPSCTRAF